MARLQHAVGEDELHGMCEKLSLQWQGELRACAFFGAKLGYQIQGGGGGLFLFLFKLNLAATLILRPSPPILPVS